MNFLRTIERSVGAVMERQPEVVVTQAERTRDGQTRVVAISLALEPPHYAGHLRDRWTLAVLDGAVTGYERIYVLLPDQQREPDELEVVVADITKLKQHGWNACAGGMGWDRLFVPPDQFAVAIDSLLGAKTLREGLNK